MDIDVSHPTSINVVACALGQMQRTERQNAKASYVFLDIQATLRNDDMAPSESYIHLVENVLPS